MDRLHYRAFLCDHLAQIRHSCVKICTIFFWWGTDSIDHCLQLSALRSLEKVADHGAIVHSTAALIIMASVPCGVQNTCLNLALFSHYHCENFVAFFLLLLPV